MTEIRHRAIEAPRGAHQNQRPAPAPPLPGWGNGPEAGFSRTGPAESTIPGARGGRPLIPPSRTLRSRALFAGIPILRSARRPPILPVVPPPPPGPDGNPAATPYS